MIYLLISKENRNFEEYCHACQKNVVEENLVVNGGTLQMRDAVFYSNILIVACEESVAPQNVIGFVALAEKAGVDIYINQIGVKKDFKRQGIGTALVDKIKEYAGFRDVICDVRSFNIASQRMFESCGFIKNNQRSNENNYFYRHKSKHLTEGVEYVNEQYNKRVH